MAIPRKTRRGDWEVRVSVVVDGQQRRRHVRGRTRLAVTAQAEQVRQDLLGGDELGEAGAALVGAWLESWVVERRTAGVRPSTLSGYRTDLKHLAPLDKVRLDRLTPERVSKLWAALLAAGLSSGSVRHVSRTLSAALTTAVNRGRIRQNPARLAAKPADATPDILPLTVAEAHALLAVARGVRNGPRWSIALALGLRQGEVLGLRWSDIDLDAGEVRVQRSMDRPRWQHGCGSPANCGRAAWCPRRHGGGGPAPMKTRGSVRSLSLAQPLVESLRAHRATQSKERLACGSGWKEGDWVFADQFGGSVHHRYDHEQFHRLLAEVGIKRRIRIHDLRHTAATLQMAAGTDSRVLMSLFGWTSPVLVARYAHVVEETKRAAANKMADVLWPQRGIG